MYNYVKEKAEKEKAADWLTFCGIYITKEKDYKHLLTSYSD